MAIVGAGPVGLALAIDLGMRGHRVVVLGKLDCVAAGSKAICYSKRSLDILDRLGVAQIAVAQGVTWNVGKVFWKDRREPVYQFDVLPLKNQKMPGFINLQQYRLEDMLIERLAQLPNVELRWGHEVTGVTPGADGVDVSVATREGNYRHHADWIVACDGSRSTVRKDMGLEFEGRAFEDNFLIADIRMRGDRPSERWFWFDPPFNPGKTALMHKQPDDIWRLDFQLGSGIDRDACARPENVDPLIRGMLGDDIEYEPVWYSIYSFQCRRMARFVHGRVIFAGDSAHLVSPFGARGCNGGLADIDNLGWKLDHVLTGRAGTALLETYDHEATVTADENILNSTRSTDFLSPKNAASHVFRDAVLGLAGQFGFARTLVNSGRLSTPVSYPNSSLNTPDEDDWCGLGIAPGSPAIDAPLGSGWFLESLTGHFTLVCNGAELPLPDGVRSIHLAAIPGSEVVAERLALDTGAAMLIRPDHYVAARWKRPDVEHVRAALLKAQGR